jgi:hypothetical protein
MAIDQSEQIKRYRSRTKFESYLNEPAHRNLYEFTIPGGWILTPAKNTLINPVTKGRIAIIPVPTSFSWSPNLLPAADLDLFIVGQSGKAYPIGFKSKQVAHSNSVGEWFGIDINPFAKLSFLFHFPNCLWVPKGGWSVDDDYPSQISIRKTIRFPDDSVKEHFSVKTKFPGPKSRLFSTFVNQSRPVIHTPK